MRTPADSWRLRGACLALAALLAGGPALAADRDNNGVDGDEIVAPARVLEAAVAGGRTSVPFPLARDRFDVQFFPNWWNQGDTGWGSRAVAESAITRAEISLVLTVNGMTCDLLDLAFSINGVTVGTIRVAPSQAPGVPIVRSLGPFPPISGPVYELRYTVTRTVLPGCGSVQLDLSGGSRVELIGDCSPPPAPGGVTATDSLCDSIVVSWNGVPGVDGYNIYRDSAFLGTRSGGVTSFTDRTASVGTHAYRVSAFSDGCGESGQSAAATGERLGAPRSPSGVGATRTLCDRIRVTWSDVQGEDGYRIFRDGGPTPLVTLGAGATRFDDTGVQAGVHAYTVEAYNACGGLRSRPATGERRSAPARPGPLAPAEGDTLVGAGIALSWEPVPGAAAFRVQVARDRGFRDIVIEALVDSADTELSRAVELTAARYHWRVRAENICGDGDYSSSRSFVVIERPTVEASAPEGLTIIYDQLRDPVGTFCAATATVRNTGSSPVAWTAVAAAPWLSVRPAAGELAAAASQAVDLCVATVEADSLADGTHAGTVRFFSGNVLADSLVVPLVVVRYALGDVTGDRLLDELDLAALLAHLLEIRSLPENVLARGLEDTNTDGAVNVADLVTLAGEIAAGLLADGAGRWTSPPPAVTRLGLRFEPSLDTPSARLILEGDGVGFRSLALRLRAASGGAAAVGLAPVEGGDVSVAMAARGADVAIVFYAVAPEVRRIAPGNSLELGTLSWRGRPGEPWMLLWGRHAESAVSTQRVGTAGGTGQAVPAPAAPALLLPAAPNPLVAGTRLTFVLGARTLVHLAVYDAAGRFVRTLVSGERVAGGHRATWDGTDAGGGRVPAGVYFVRLRTPDTSLARRAVVLR